MSDPSCSKIPPLMSDPSCSKYPPISKLTDPSCSKYPPISKLTDPKYPAINILTDPSCSKYPPISKLTDPSCSKYPPMKFRGGASPVIVSDEREGLVKESAGEGTGSEGRKSTAPEKVAAALKNHSQAEKRRRERINAHLATLRTLIPGTSKMEKASLLAEVITHMKQLKSNATDATRSSVIPLDSDEVIVDYVSSDGGGESESSSFHIKAMVCCDFKHEILFDLKKSLDALPYLKLVKIEIGTLGDRMKTTFVLMSGFSAQGSQLSYEYLSESVRRALTSVIDSFTAAKELSIDVLLSKRRRRSSSALII